MNKIYFVGAGPGGADLITVRGREILREADVVIYDYLVDKRLLDEAKVAVIPGEPFGWDTHIRLSFATGIEDIKKGLDRIDERVKGL